MVLAVAHSEKNSFAGERTYTNIRTLGPQLAFSQGNYLVHRRAEEKHPHCKQFRRNEK